MLETVQANILGVVVNQTEPRPGYGYGRYGYRSSRYRYGYYYCRHPYHEPGDDAESGDGQMRAAESPARQQSDARLPGSETIDSVSNPD